MKCPNCGQEVVIATDLCPWCGCQHSFDGSIERVEPYAHEDDCVSARLNRRRGRRVPEDWTEAGIFRSGASGGDRGQRPAAAFDAWTPPERGLRWYHFAVNVLLPFTGAYYIWRFLSLSVSIAASISASPYLYFAFPLMLATGLATAAAYLICGILAFTARSRLKRMDRRGVGLYIAVILAPELVEFVHTVVTVTSLGLYYTDMFSLTVELVGVIVYAVLTAIYFRRRAGLFR